MISKKREAELLQKLKEKDLELARRDDRIAALECELRFLREKIDSLVRRVFGRSSEQADEAQMELEGLLGKGPAPAPGQTVAAGETGFPCSEEQRQEPDGRRPRARKPLPEHLPVEEEIVVPLEVQAAPEDYRCIGEEVTERLDYRPARYLRLRTVRRKYVWLKDSARPPVVAPVAAQLADKLSATPSMIAHVVVAKYADHLPLYRQAAILQDRHGLNTTRQTLCQWVRLAGDSLGLVYEQVRAEVLGSDYVQVDETPVEYLDPGGGKTRTGYFWTVHRPAPPGQARGPSFYQWHASRAADCLEQVLGKDYTGILQCDGYAAYESHAGRHALALAACWAHARRKFFEAKDYDPLMKEALGIIGALYRIEKQLRTACADPAERRRVRQARSLPILHQLHARLQHWQSRQRFLPASAAGKALSYTLDLWNKLTLFADQGHLEIDNNLCENVIRPTALGKKNWLFIGNKEAGQTSAVLFTLVNECRRLDLNPHDYFTRALTLLPTATNRDIASFTPAALAPSLPLIPRHAAA